MARSSNARVTEAPKERPNTTSRRPRSVPKTKPDGDARRLDAEVTEFEPGTEEGGEDETQLPETDEATPPEPAKRRGRKPGVKVAKTPSQSSKLQQLVVLAESVLAFGNEHEAHPVDVLNSIEALLKATGEIQDA